MGSSGQSNFSKQDDDYLDYAIGKNDRLVPKKDSRKGHALKGARQPAFNDDYLDFVVGKDDKLVSTKMESRKSKAFVVKQERPSPFASRKHRPSADEDFLDEVEDGDFKIGSTVHDDDSL
jgi:hypothetical protein